MTARKLEVVCYHCGKSITGQAVMTNPPLSLVRLGLDFSKSFHPPCYKQAEAAALREIKS